MIWALRQSDGNIAKVFADIRKAPDDKGKKSGKPPSSDDPPPPIEWLPIFEEYGLLNLSEDGIPKLIITSSGYDFRTLTPVSFHLSRWLLRHLDKVQCLNWVLERGTILNHDFRKRARFELEDNNTEIPLGMRKVWHLLLSENYVSKTVSSKISRAVWSWIILALHRT